MWSHFITLAWISLYPIPWWQPMREVAFADGHLPPLICTAVPTPRIGARYLKFISLAVVIQCRMKRSYSYISQGVDIFIATGQGGMKRQRLFFMWGLSTNVYPIQCNLQLSFSELNSIESIEFVGKLFLLIFISKQLKIVFYKFYRFYRIQFGKTRISQLANIVPKWKSANNTAMATGQPWLPYAFDAITILINKLYI